MRQGWATVLIGKKKPTETRMDHYIIRHKFHGLLKIYITLQEIK